MKNTLGTVQHEVTHLNTPPGNKHPKWIEETLSDYVRLKAGFVEERASEEAKERHYCNGYNTGAAFFDWLEREGPGFIHALTSHITEHRDDDWLGGYPQDASNSDAVFAAVTGAPLAELWHDYRESLGAIDPPLDCDEASWRNY